jgi:hypothetical protein
VECHGDRDMLSQRVKGGLIDVMAKRCSIHEEAGSRKPGARVVIFSRPVGRTCDYARR